MPKVIIFSQIMRKNEHIAACIASVKNQLFDDFNYYIEANNLTYPLLTELVAGDKRIKIILNNNLQQAGFLHQYQKLVKLANYIAIIDGDDLLAADFLAKQIEFCRKHSLDIGCCSVAAINQEGQQLGLVRSMPAEIIIERANFGLGFAYYFPFMRSMWGKLIASKLFNNQLKENFPKPDSCGGYGLDTYFGLEILKGAQRLGIAPDIGYYYRVGQPSASHDFNLGREKADLFLRQTIEQFLATTEQKGNNFNQFFGQAVYLNGLVDSINLLKDCSLDDKEKPAKLFAILDIESLRHTIPIIKDYYQLNLQADDGLNNLRLALKAFCNKYGCQMDSYAYQLLDIWLLIGED